MKKRKADVNNIYRLDGRVPVASAVPFGLQHILAMFVANIAPILIVAGASGLDDVQSGKLIQSAMIIAGIGTMIQLFSAVAHRFRAPHRHGHQLYLRIRLLLYRTGLWI